MKKLSLLLGTLGGAMAGYLFSKPKLREELAKAKDPEKVGAILAKHLKDDSKKIGTEVKAFVESDEVQKNLKAAKEYANKQFQQAKKQMTTYMKQGAKSAKTAMKGASKKAKGKSKNGFKQEEVE